MNSALGQLILARWRSFYREPSTIFWTFGFPIILSVVLGLAFRNKAPEPIFVGIESSPESDSLQQLLATSPDIRASVMSADQASQALRTGRVSIVVRGESTREYHYDPTRPESRLARAVLDDAIERGLGRADVGQTSDRIVNEPGARYIDFLIPGLIGSGLMSSGLWGLGYALVEMRTRKLLKRLHATPMRRSDFLLSFLIARSLVIFIELPALLSFAHFVFGVPIVGSLALIFLLSLMGALIFSTMGLLIASRAKNTQTVAGLINLASFPMYLLSGVFFTSARFPDAMQPFIKALPLTALNDALRSVMIDGAGFTSVIRPMIVMMLWAAACFALSLRLFRWR